VETEADDLDAVLAAFPESDRRWAERFAQVDPEQLYHLEKDLSEQRARIATAQPQDDSDLGAADAIVSLLIDHSGSMRGQPMLFAARAALVASDLLDSVGTGNDRFHDRALERRPEPEKMAERRRALLSRAAAYCTSIFASLTSLRQRSSSCPT
jgi:hypothetical protein